MGKNTFDMEELQKFVEFDAVHAEKNFKGRAAYFDALNRFTREATDYLQSYTPFVVVNSEEVRRDFLDELHQIKVKLSSLGMLDAVRDLESLGDMACGKDAKILSDGLLTFHCEMDILAKRVSAAHLTNTRADKTDQPIIMAVDDKPEFLAIVTKMLEERYKVIALTNANDAILALQKHSPSLFLLDIEMPEVNGYELARRIRESEKYKNVPILYLTGIGTRDYVMAAKKSGGNDFILKTVSRDVLLDKIEYHLKRNSVPLESNIG